MKGTDRFLIAIVAGALLIAGAATVTALLHKNEVTYRADDTPEGVAYNYVLALQQGDYARAYGYLSPKLPGYPQTVETFARDLSQPYRSRTERAAALEVEPARITGDIASVPTHETVFNGGGLFNSGEYTIGSEVMLRRENGTWKVFSNSNGAYWSPNWQP